MGNGEKDKYELGKRFGGGTVTPLESARGFQLLMYWQALHISGEMAILKYSRWEEQACSSRLRHLNTIPRPLHRFFSLKSLTFPLSFIIIDMIY